MPSAFKIIFLYIFSAIPLGTYAQAPTPVITDYMNNARKLNNSTECIPILLVADSIAKSTNDMAGRAAVNDQLGAYYYTRNADKSIAYFQKARKCYLVVDNKKRAALCLHNIAFAYQEQKKNIPEALKYTQLAIKEQTALKDTLSQANMYKFLGMLQGKMHHYPEAKKSIGRSIMLFSLKSYSRGIAVAMRDLAMVYSDEHKMDSCIMNLLKAKEIWKGYTDTLRIFNLNNSLLDAYLLSNNPAKARDMILENREILTQKQVYFKDKLDFYQSANKFFNKNKENNMADAFARDYKILSDSLVREGINVQ